MTDSTPIPNPPGAPQTGAELHAPPLAPCFICAAETVCAHRETELRAWYVLPARKPPGRETARAARKAAGL